MNEYQALLTYIYELARKAPATAEEHAKAFNVYQRVLQHLQDPQPAVDQSLTNDDKSKD
jgi:recombinational DNA repair protein (RecF pathway)